MKVSIYLHKPIANVLQCFGNLDEVINRILEEAANGKFDVMDKPPCPDRDGANRYDVNIIEPNYLELLSIYSPFSPKISLRRVIYWFVENEIYEELNWQQCRNFEDRDLKLFNNKINNGLNEFQRAVKYAPKQCLSKLNEIINNIVELQEFLKNGR